MGPETEQWADELTDEQMASRQQAVGFSKAGYQEDLQRIFSTGCAKIDDGEVYWRGCFQRRFKVDSDPDYIYYVDSSWSSGHHNSFWGYLDWGKTIHDYTSGHNCGRAIKWKPMATFSDGGGCHQETIGLSAYGIPISDTFPVCPATVGPDIRDFYLHSIWDGSVSSDGVWVSASAMTLVRRMQNANSFTGFQYTIST